MPSASCDWRFLPGMPPAGRALVISLAHADAAVGLLTSYEQVVVVTAAVEKTAVLPASLAANGRWHWLSTDTLHGLALGQFDLVALPHGFWQTPLADLALVRQWLRSGGVVYVGFNGRWRWRGRPVGAGWSVRQMKRLLAQADLQPSVAYGLLPNLVQPAAIFPLTATAATQALNRTVRSARLRRWLLQPAWRGALPHILPAYGLVATARLAQPT